MSILPVPGLGSGRPPSLAKEIALLWFGVGLAGGIGGILSSTMLATLEPFAFDRVKVAGLGWWAFASGAALTITARFGFKQWRYYFMESGIGKEGIFIQTLGHVSVLEETLDALLCLVSGLLVSACALPTVWFAVLAAYSMCVIVRASLTLLRPFFARRLKRRGITLSNLYTRLEVYHNDFWVPAVLWGWLATHGVVVLFSVSTILFLRQSELLADGLQSSTIIWAALRRVGAIAVLGVALFLASDSSYRFGCNRRPPPAVGSGGSTAASVKRSKLPRKSA